MKFKLNESSFKSGDRYYGGLPSELSASEYAKMIDAAKTNQQAILDMYNIEVEKSPNHIIYTGSVNGHDFTLIENVDGFNNWVNTLIIDNNEVDKYNSPARPGSISKMFEVNKSGILAVIDFIEKDALDQLVYEDEPLTEASNTTVYRAEYYEPKLDKWISYYENNSLDAVKSNLDNPIVGDPKKRIAQYERSGIRKPSYKFVKEVDATLEEAVKYYPQDYNSIELNYDDLEIVDNKGDEITIDYSYEVDKDDFYTFIVEQCIDVEDFPRMFDDDFDPNNKEDWNSFVAWLEDNFDEIFTKYEEQILEHYRSSAVEKAEENYDPDDYIDWDSMPGGHDDIMDRRFDEELNSSELRYTPKRYGMHWWGIIDHNLNNGSGLMMRIGENPDYSAPLDANENKLLLFKSKELAQEKCDELNSNVNESAEKICCICKEPYEGYGNNAEPVCSGTCCDKCNIERVVPMRFKKMNESKELNESMSIDDILDAFGGADELRNRVSDIKDNYPGIEDDEIAEMLADDVDYEDCLSAIEYLDEEDFDDPCYNESLSEATIHMSKAEMDKLDKAVENAQREVGKYKIPMKAQKNSAGETVSVPDFDAVPENQREAAKKAYDNYVKAVEARPDRAKNVIHYDESLNEDFDEFSIKDKWCEDQDDYGNPGDERIYSTIARYFNSNDIECWYWQKDYSSDRGAKLVIETADGDIQYFEEHDGSLYSINESKELDEFLIPSPAKLINNVFGESVDLNEDTGTDTKKLVIDVLDILAKSDKNTWTKSAKTVVENIPDDELSTVLEAIKAKAKDIDIPDNKVRELSNTMNVNNDEARSASTIGNLLDLVDIQQWAKTNPEAVKAAIVGTLSVISIVEPTPLGELITLIVTALPDNVIAKIVEMWSTFTLPTAANNLFKKFSNKENELHESKELTEASDNGVENDWEYIQSDETKDDENTWQPLTLWKNKKTGEFRIIIGDYNPWDGFSNFESFDEEEAMDEFDAYLDDPCYNESLEEDSDYVDKQLDDDYNYDDMDKMLTENTDIKRLRHMYGVED